MATNNSIDLDISQASGTYTIKGGTGTRKSLIVNGTSASVNDLGFTFTNILNLIGGAATATLTFPTGTGTLALTTVVNPFTMDTVNNRVGLNQVTPAAILDIQAPAGSAAIKMLRLTQVATPTANAIDILTSAAASIFSVSSAGIVQPSGYKSSTGVAGLTSTVSGLVFIDGLFTSGALTGTFSWTTITANTTAAGNTGYFVNSTSSLDVTLPSAPTVGQSISIVGINTGGWVLKQPALTTVRFGMTATTSGTGGSLEIGRAHV